MVRAALVISQRGKDAWALNSEDEEKVVLEISVPEMPIGQRLVVPDNAKNWKPTAYRPGPDEPGAVATECGLDGSLRVGEEH